MSKKLSPVQKITSYLKGDLKQSLSDKEMQLLEIIEFANSVNNGSEIKRRKIVDKITDEYGFDFRVGFKLLEQAEIIYGEIEYPGLRSDQVFHMRILEWTYKQLETEWMKEKKTWYMDQMQNVQDKMLKIQGTYNSKYSGLDYSRWQRPRLTVTNDIKVLNEQFPPEDGEFSEE